MKTILRILALSLAVCASASADSKEVKIKLLQTSDVHGNYFPTNFITRQPAKGSLARVYAAVKDMRQEFDGNVILLDNGDILQGQPTAYYYNYMDTVAPHVGAQVLNFMKYDAANVGNHDVETGRGVLERWASQCDMPILGANIIDTATGEPRFTPYKIVELDGIKVAILGMITPAIPAWLPESLWHGLRFDDMEATARKWIPIIRQKENPDVMVGMFHAGQAPYYLAGTRENASIEVAERVPGFDIVLMGHDHRRENRKVVNIDGDTVLVMNPASNATMLTDITMTFDIGPDGRIAEKKIDGRLTSTDTYAPDPEMLEVFKPQIDKVSAFVSSPIGQMEEDITTRDAYFGPSKFVDLIHQLQLDLTGADISFAAPLSYDASILKGPIVTGDMFSLYKYENMLYVMELTGQEIKDYLEYAYSIWTNQMKSPDDHLLLFKEKPTEGDAGRSTLQYPSYNFDSAAGIIYEVDVTKPSGTKVKIISMADGSEFNPDHTYRVALNSYRGNGGGELLTKGAGIPQDKLSSRVIFSTDRDLRFYLIDHIRKLGRVNPPLLDQWKFVPEQFVSPAAARDYMLLFPNR